MSHRDNLKFLIRAIRPSLDGDIYQKVGLILLAHNLARTLSPLIGGYFADKYQKFKLIATIGYITGKLTNDRFLFDWPKLRLFQIGKWPVIDAFQT